MGIPDLLEMHCDAHKNSHARIIKEASQKKINFTNETNNRLIMSSSPPPCAPVEERTKESSDDGTAVPPAEALKKKKEELFCQVVANACTLASCAEVQKRFMTDDSPPLPMTFSGERKKESSDDDNTAVPLAEAMKKKKKEELLCQVVADAAMIAQTQVQRRYMTGDESPFSGVLRSWGLRWENDRDDAAAPPPQSSPPAEPKEEEEEEEEERYMTQEDMCAIAQAEVQRHFMSLSSWDEVRGKNDPRWKR